MPRKMLKGETLTKCKYIDLQCDNYIIIEFQFKALYYIEFPRNETSAINYQHFSQNGSEEDRWYLL